MAQKTFLDVLKAQWQADPKSVPALWRDYFSKGSGLSGVGKKIAQNMEESLKVPTATSSRQLAVLLLEENRNLINDHLAFEKKGKCSFTHLIAYGIVKALQKIPALNNGYFVENGVADKRIRSSIHLGIAIDLESKSGQRSLLVPNIKNAETLNFKEFFETYNEIVKKAKIGKLAPSDFEGTTVTLTNPGGIGTLFSVPRLMVGQGAIIAAGRIGYPEEWGGVKPSGVSKTMTLTSTYDHRIIQGAESGLFLQYLCGLLLGENGFYEDIFKDLNVLDKPYGLKDIQVSHRSRFEKSKSVERLMESYRQYGFFKSRVDPLGLQVGSHESLSLSFHGLSLWDLELVYRKKTLREILKKLKEVYCGPIAIQLNGISNLKKKDWILAKVEGNEYTLSREEKSNLLNQLILAETLEQFLHKRYLGQKRFSIEGLECLIPLLNDTIEAASKEGYKNVFLGMAHRGRLNTLCHVVGKPYHQLFLEFEDQKPKSKKSGDVKYHMGYSSLKKTSQGEIAVELLYNPSHLEAVYPVLEGVCRAKNTQNQKTLAIAIHGDAAMAGQGVVYETLQMGGLVGYGIGGTLHVVMNNQIGYTTVPKYARTSAYCSDVAKVVEAPVFRVNADYPEHALKTMRLAFEYLQVFGEDVFVELVGYRKYGHNEGDEPAFTQPILYEQIHQHASVVALYERQLIEEKAITAEQVDAIKKEIKDRLEDESKKKTYEVQNIQEHPWVLSPLTKDRLLKIGDAVTTIPTDFHAHPRLKTQLLDKRKAMLQGSVPIDFGMAELLAYGSLAEEGVWVRLSGQDCGRGTFAHRHAILYDTYTQKPHNVLSALSKKGEFEVYDSLLSEEAVLGYEYGYSVAHPQSLVIWEAQFGDFYNGAQVMVDQFIASGEQKWGQTSNLVMLLPHGYDGSGPEHSSGRMERFLQLCAQDNLRVVNCSTAAQLFLAIRRQMQGQRKPLIAFTHKNILRLEEASSQLNDFLGEFQGVLEDPKLPKKPERLLLCAGKIYYELDAYRQKISDSKVAICRIEQLYPLEHEKLELLIKKLSVKEIVWVQEESQNNGAYLYLKYEFEKMGVVLRYVGRKASASPAVGSLKIHLEEQNAILKAAFGELKQNQEIG